LSMIVAPGGPTCNRVRCAAVLNCHTMMPVPVVPRRAPTRPVRPRRPLLPSSAAEIWYWLNFVHGFWKREFPTSIVASVVSYNLRQEFSQKTLPLFLCGLPGPLFGPAGSKKVPSPTGDEANKEFEEIPLRDEYWPLSCQKKSLKYGNWLSSPENFVIWSTPVKATRTFFCVHSWPISSTRNSVEGSPREAIGRPGGQGRCVEKQHARGGVWRAARPARRNSTCGACGARRGRGAASVPTHAAPPQASHTRCGGGLTAGPRRRTGAR